MLGRVRAVVAAEVRTASISAPSRRPSRGSSSSSRHAAPRIDGLVEGVAHPGHAAVGGQRLGHRPIRRPVGAGGLQHLERRVPGRALQPAADRAEAGEHHRVGVAPGRGRHPGREGRRRELVVGQQDQGRVEHPHPLGVGRQRRQAGPHAGGQGGRAAGPRALGRSQRGPRCAGTGQLRQHGDQRRHQRCGMGLHRVWLEIDAQAGWRTPARRSPPPAARSAGWTRGGRRRPPSPPGPHRGRPATRPPRAARRSTAARPPPRSSTCGPARSRRGPDRSGGRRGCR